MAVVARSSSSGVASGPAAARPAEPPVACYLSSSSNATA
jgi:hypothetical protein